MKGFEAHFERELPPTRGSMRVQLFRIHGGPDLTYRFNRDGFVEGARLRYVLCLSRPGRSYLVESTQNGGIGGWGILAKSEGVTPSESFYNLGASVHGLPVEPVQELAS